MANLTALFALLGGLLVLAFLANSLAHRTRVPDVIVLMLAGLLLGPVLGWVEAGDIRTVTRAFGILAIILILFEGGLELKLRDTIRHSPGGLLFALLVYLLSVFGIGAVARWALHLTTEQAAVVGAVLGCTSIAIILPTLQQMKVREPVKVTLLLEASLGEVFAVLTVGILLEQMDRPGPFMKGFLSDFFSEITVALTFAALAGFGWTRLMPRLSKQPFWQALTFSVVLLLYAATEAVDASGLIAVFGFGLMLANFSAMGPRLVEATFGIEVPVEEPHRQILAFHSELAFLVRTFFFVLLGVVVEFAGLSTYLLPALGVLGVLFLARWIAVRASRWSWREIQRPESELIFLMLPRGLITAVLAIQVASARGAELAFLPTLAFTIILATSLLVILASTRAAKHGVTMPLTGVQDSVPVPSAPTAAPANNSGARD